MKKNHKKDTTDNNEYQFFKNQLEYYKNKKGYTNKQICTLTQIPESTITKIFAGINTNPTLDTIKKIASVLDCTLDDLLNPNADEALSPYYLDRNTGKIAEEIKNNTSMKMLFDNTRDMPEDDIKAIIEIAKRMKNTKK